MTDPYFPLLPDVQSDDLPRTLRREREARREAMERGRMSAPGFVVSGGTSVAAGQSLAPAAVMRFDVPFGHLMRFYLKAVFAAVPALILLGAMGWIAVMLATTVDPQQLLTAQLSGAGSVCHAASAEQPPLPLARLDAGTRPAAATQSKAGAGRKRAAEGK